MAEQKGTPESEGWVRRQMALLGLDPAGPLHAEAQRMAVQGYPAWRIAEALGCAPERVERLGGPRRA